MYNTYVEMHGAFNLKKPGTNKKAKSPMKMGNTATTQVVTDKIRVEPKCGKHCGKRT